MLLRVAKSSGKKYTKQKSSKERHFPFRRLPREIIAEIFFLCLPDFEDVFDSIKSKNAAPLLLCNVSSSWRSLALSITRLWNELSIKIANPEVDIDLAVSMTESWIARSEKLPLRLRLHANLWNERGQVAPMIQEYLNIFFRRASRWESVDISVKICATFAISFPKFGPTPLLRKFSYSTPWRGSVPSPFTSCPLLSAFSWPFSCSTASNPEIPWHQLTHFTMERHISTHQTLDVLRTCKMLVEFKVEIFDDPRLDEVVQPLQKPVKIRSLRKFHIYVHFTCSALLQSLTLPALTDFSLRIDFDNFNSSWTGPMHTQLLRLFTRSRCRLEKLKLGNCRFNDACILQCLKHHSCSSLTELEIPNGQDQPMFTDRIILALTNKDGGVHNVLLPKLSCLTLDKCLSTSPGVLGKMVLIRCLRGNKVDQLKSLVLVRDLDDTDHRYLKMAEKLGLEVDITIFEPNTESKVTEDYTP